MPVPNLILTKVYLDPKQRAALERRARKEKAEIPDLIRRAVDAYIELGMSPDELALLDVASISAKADFDAIWHDLNDINSTVRTLRKEIFDLRARAARGEAV